MSIIPGLQNDYRKYTLSRNDMPYNPMELFNNWLEQVIDEEVNEPSAMALATVNEFGQPSCRIVLLKEVALTGIRFFTNYDSRKGKEIAVNPLAATTFFWPELERQIRIEGEIHKVENYLSDGYFEIRSRESQIGTWASYQSKTIENRRSLEEQYKKLEKQFVDKPIPRPPYWGGFELVPTRIEFWQGRTGRLHDRFEYHKTQDGWNLNRLAP